jgi:broad specificity phosphatase PhoE
MVKILIVRHGYSQGNANANAFVGQSDSPLTPIGREQANEVCEFVLKNYSVDKVFSSDLSRASDTIKPLAEKLKLKVNLSKNLREFDVGWWEGKSFAHVEEIDGVRYRAYRALDETVKLGDAESLSDVGERAQSEILRIAKDSDGKTIVIATHFWVVTTFLTRLLGLSIKEFLRLYEIKNASLTEIEFDGERFKINLIGKDDYLSTPTTLKKLFAH